MRNILLAALSLLLMWLPCEAVETKIPLSLEFARTQDERATGLMGRHSLPDNHGMLFCYKEPEIISVWMYNCYIDLSVAFIDSNKMITEIHDLKAYPEAMKLPESLRKEFFQFTAVGSKVPVFYSLEVPMGWFQAHGIIVGDTLELIPNSVAAYIIHK